VNFTRKTPIRPVSTSRFTAPSYARGAAV